MQEIWDKWALSVRRDDFSIQVSSGRDPRFWLRIETPTPGSIIVSDLMPSTVPDLDCADLLAEFVRLLADADHTVIRFSNIVPRGSDAPTDPDLVNFAYLRLRSLLESVAVASGRRLEAARLDRVGSKHDAVFDMRRLKVN